MVVDGGILAAVYADQLPEDEIVEPIEVPGYVSAPFVVQSYQQFRDDVLGMSDFPVGVVHFTPFMKLFGFFQVANCGVVAQNDQMKRISGFYSCPVIDIRRVTLNHVKPPEIAFYERCGKAALQWNLFEFGRLCFYWVLTEISPRRHPLSVLGILNFRTQNIVEAAANL
jgi:hypothetical protein